MVPLYASYGRIQIKDKLRRAKMFNKITLTLITILMLVSLAACGTTGTSSTESTTPSAEPESASTDNYQMLPYISGSVADLKLDASADGSTQQLKVGQVLSISLESNPSTGYSWSATSSDQAVMMQMGEPQMQEPTASSTPVVGAPGTATLYFQAIKAGTATVTLNYQRSWEQGVTPEKTIIITVEVK